MLPPKNLKSLNTKTTWRVSHMKMFCNAHYYNSPSRHFKDLADQLYVINNSGVILVCSSHMLIGLGGDVAVWVDRKCFFSMDSDHNRSAVFCISETLSYAVMP